MSTVAKEAAKGIRQKVPKGATNWPRALPSINVRRRNREFVENEDSWQVLPQFRQRGLEFYFCLSSHSNVLESLTVKHGLFL